MKESIWMLVTADEYELPICVEKSVTTLANKLKVSKSLIVNTERFKSNSRKLGGRVVKI